MKFERAYDAAPVWLQNLMCSAYGWQLSRRRYDRGYREVEERVFSNGKLDRHALFELQEKRLQDTISHAASTVPYYRKLFQKLRLAPEDIRAPSDLSILPVLQKSDIQDDPSQFVSSFAERMSTSSVATSGTTGTGLVFPVSLDAEREQWAVWWRYRAQFGIDRKTWYAHFYGRSVVPLHQTKPPYWRINRPGRQIFFSGYHMNPDHMHLYVEALNTYRPPWLQGYPSLLALLATYVVESGQRLRYTPTAVTVGAESLLPQQKAIIEKAFGVPCRQHYGSAEAVANISECPQGRLHVDEDFGCAEFVKDANGALQLIATGFANRAFVLLRYQIGDTITLPGQQTPCPCGNPGRVVESIDGRSEDYVITPEGNRIGRLDHIVKGMLNLRECQIVQNEVGAITIRVVRGANYTQADEDKILHETGRRLGPSTRIDIEYTDALARSSRGKLRFVVSNLSAGKLDRHGASADSTR